MELYEIHATLEGENVTLDVYEKMIATINDVIATNVNPFLDKDGKEVTLPDGSVFRGRLFHYNVGKLALFDRNWGVKHNPTDDVAELSKAFPEYVINLVRTWSVTSVTEIGNLENFWKAEFQMGVLTDSFKAKPIVWESETIRNWYDPEYVEAV